MATDVGTEPAGAGEPPAAVAAPQAEPAVRPIRLSDLGGALSACEATQPEGWSACITRELEARGYRVEAEAGEAAAPAASEASTAAGAGEPAPEAAPAP